MRPTVDELVARYPVKFNLPFKDGFLLLWHSESEGQRSILARTERQVVDVFKSDVERHGLVEAREFWRVSAVAPPGWYREACAEAAYAEDVRQFAAGVVGMVHWVVFGAKYDPRPDLASFAGFRACAGRVDEEGDVAHYGCSPPCEQGILPRDDPSWEDFYERAGRRPPALREDSGETPAGDLPDCDPDRVLYALHGDFGHHRDGLSIRTVRRGEHVHEDQMLFHGTREEVPGEVRDILAAERAVQETQKTELRRVFRDRRERESAEAEADLRTLFPDVEIKRSVP